MSPLLILRLAWADVLERVRRASFLLTLGATLWLGSLVYTGNIQMWTGNYRGLVNSAWIGTVMALTVTTFVSLVGFYIVKNAVERDRRTGVGQILAATRVPTSAYLVGKWLSNFLVLAAIVATLACAAVILHLLLAEGTRLDVWALLSPMLLLALPAMAVVAAFAVLFETVPFLNGGVGNVVYVVVWNLTLVIPLINGIQWADWSGISVVDASLTAAVQAQIPGAVGDISFTAGPPKDLSTFTVFEWMGIDWDVASVLLRLSWFVVAAITVAGAASWFDRFDGPRLRRSAAPVRPPRADDESQPDPSEGRWGRLSSVSRLSSVVGHVGRGRVGAMVLAELRLAMIGVSHWWTAVAVGLAVASVLAPLPVARVIHGVAWIWPLLLWSKMGVRETECGTGPVIFSCPRPLRRQFLALWLAGVVLTAMTGAGFATRVVIDGAPGSLAAWAAGVVFIPSLALALGVWSGSRRAFEALYTAWWYVGPMHAIAVLDFTGAWSTDTDVPTAAVYGGTAAALFALATLGRRRQLRRFSPR